MATAIAGPKSVELFYSYAHCDELLCQELQKHLTALKRAGLISDWYDRKIDPGSEWAPEIKSAMERAGVILLLISADFIASKYIFDIELPFALERHKLGLAKVIPVLMRPVEWHDLPFAALQMLPSKALPVTSWPNTDQAFYDVALRLRELLYGQRQSEQQDRISKLADAATRQRLLDAAIASSVVVDEPVDVVAMLRTSKSGGLRAILRLDKTYSPASEDVKSQPLDIDFQRDALGKLLPATLTLGLLSPGFDPPSQTMNVRIPPTGDSSVFVFMLTPRRAGTSRLTLQILADGLVIATQLLVTRSVLAGEAQPQLAYNVVSMPLSTPESDRLINATIDRATKYSSALPMQTQAQMQVQEQTAALPRPAKRSSRGLWVGIGSSAAALVLFSSTFLFRSVEPPPTHGTLTESSRNSPTVLPEEKKAAKARLGGTDSLKLNLARLSEQFRSAEERALGSRDPRIPAIESRLRLNFQNADRAINRNQAEAARTYMSQIQTDLTALEQIGKSGVQ